MDIEHKTSGPVRDSSIYISWQTRKSLNLAALKREQTPDALAEQIIDKWLAENEQAIICHVHDQQQREVEFKKSLSKVPFA